MSKVEIELHTIATYNNKQYELQDLLNDLINMNLKLQQKIDKATKIIENDTDLNSQRQRQRLLEILKGEE